MTCRPRLWIAAAMFAVCTAIPVAGWTRSHPVARGQEVVPESAAAPTDTSSTDDTLEIPAENSRQFDFWIGDWDVQNQHLNPDGTWRQGGRAKARISSVLSGKAVLEQWTGQGSLKLRGFSLRTYDQEQERWELVLNWHSGAPSVFSYMIGNFAEDRGEFFPPGPNRRVRFTFSKAARDSCQWDEATSADGTNWKTDWIMSFSRTGPAGSLNAETLPIRQPHESVSGKFPETRTFDSLIGNWTGSARRLTEDGTWEEGTAIRRVSSMIDGYGLLQMTSYSWGEESLAALSFDRKQQAWVVVGMGTGEADCHWLAGQRDGATFRADEIPTSNNGVNNVWRDLTEDSFTWSREKVVQSRTRDTTTVVEVHFQRAAEG